MNCNAKISTISCLKHEWPKQMKQSGRLQKKRYDQALYLRLKNPLFSKPGFSEYLAIDIQVDQYWTDDQITRTLRLAAMVPKGRMFVITCLKCRKFCCGKVILMPLSFEAIS